MTGRVFIHLPSKDVLATQTKILPFYSRLHRMFTQRGVSTQFEHKSKQTWRGGPHGDFHFVHQGNVAGPNILNTGTSYFADYRYVDPKGVYGASSIGDKQFRPAKEDEGAAAEFAEGLRRKWVAPRLSRYEQPQWAAPKRTPGYIAVFLQGWNDLSSPYLSEHEMLGAIVAAREGRDIIVKPHPRKPEDAAALIERYRGESYISFVDDNIHDLLEGADMVCTISSAVALEGYLHHKPALLFGKSDFHHIAQTIRHKDELPAAMFRARNSHPDYDLFLYWLLEKNCVHIHDKFLFRKIRRRMAGLGFDVQKLLTDAAG